MRLRIRATNEAGERKPKRFLYWHRSLQHKKNILALDGPAAAKEKIEYFRRVIVAAVGRIQGEKNPAARFEVLFQIVEKKGPFLRAPTPRFFVAAVKCSREGGDPIEFLL